MEIDKICHDYLGIKLDTAKKHTKDYCKLLDVLINVKQWSVSKVARELNSRTETVIRHLGRKPKPKPLTKEMEMRMKKYLKIEHLKH